jgi:ubiquinone biosynthesis protein UbiJ
MELVITEQDKYTRILRKAVDAYGIEAQLNQVTEEFAEVIMAINKWRRNPCEQTLDNLHEEIADSQIMIDQLLETFLSAEQVKQWYRFKMKKIADRLEKLENETSVRN